MVFASFIGSLGYWKVMLLEIHVIGKRFLNIGWAASNEAPTVKCYRFMLLLSQFTFNNPIPSPQTFLVTPSLRFDSGREGDMKRQTRLSQLVASCPPAGENFLSQIVRLQKMWGVRSYDLNGQSSVLHP